MTRRLPPAVRLVIETALDETRELGIADPATTARRVAAALVEAGWTCTPHQRPADHQRAA